MWLRLRYTLPLLAFAALAMALAIGLGRDPSYVPSALIGDPVPEVVLPAVGKHGPAFTALDFKGEKTLVNVFASWCASCLDEHPLLMEISAAGAVRIFGIAYRDSPDAASAWLDRHGNPYAATIADVDGRGGVEWGVRGVPETFFVDTAGNIVYKHVGPLTRDVWRRDMLPMITAKDGS